MARSNTGLQHCCIGPGKEVPPNVREQCAAPRSTMREAVDLIDSGGCIWCESAPAAAELATSAATAPVRSRRRAGQADRTVLGADERRHHALTDHPGRVGLLRGRDARRAAGGARPRAAGTQPAADRPDRVRLRARSGGRRAAAGGQQAGATPSTSGAPGRWCWRSRWPSRCCGRRRPLHPIQWPGRPACSGCSAGRCSRPAGPPGRRTRWSSPPASCRPGASSRSRLLVLPRPGVRRAAVALTAGAVGMLALLIAYGLWRGGAAPSDFMLGRLVGSIGYGGGMAAAVAVGVWPLVALASDRASGSRCACGRHGRRRGHGAGGADRRARGRGRARALGARLLRALPDPAAEWPAGRACDGGDRAAVDDPERGLRGRYHQR